MSCMTAIPPMCRSNSPAVYLRSTSQRSERSSALILLVLCHRTIQGIRFQWSGGSITARNRGVNEARFVLLSSVHFVGLRGWFLRKIDSPEFDRVLEHK